jgi:hypothetical protein
MDKFTKDNKIDSKYTKAGQNKNTQTLLLYLQTLSKQIGSGTAKVEDYIVDCENGKYYFGIKFIV